MSKRWWVRIGGIALAILVFGGVSVAADTLNVYPYTLSTGGNPAVWSTVQKGTGSSSVLLDYAAGDNSYVEFTPPAGTTVNDLATITDGWSWWYYLSASNGPLLELRFTGGTGHVDITVNTAESSPTVGAGTTEEVTSASTCIYFGNDPTDGTAFFDNTGAVTLAGVLAAINAEPAMTAGGDTATTWELTRVRAEIGWIGTARTCYIDDIEIAGTTYYGLIQDAVDTASASDTINVAAGTYAENLVVNKALTLKSTAGAATTIIDASTKTDAAVRGAVQIMADGVTLGGDGVGFTIIAPNATAPLPGQYGIELFVDGTWSDITIQGNTIKGNTGFSSPQYGIHFWGTATYGGLTIKDNTFTTTFVTDTTIADGLSAGMVEGANIVAISGTFEGNTITGYGKGIMLYKLGTTTFSDNTVQNCAYEGMDVGTTGKLTISGNTVSGNAGTGIDIRGAAAGTTVTHNNIYGNGDGIKVRANATSIAITYNNIYTNTNASAVLGEAFGPPLDNYTNYGINNKHTGNTLPATCNWWGDSDGPQHANNPYATTGDEVSDDVTFAPWLTSQYPGGVCAHPIPFRTNLEGSDGNWTKWSMNPDPGVDEDNLWHRVEIATKSSCPGYKSPPTGFDLGNYDWFFGNGTPNCTYDYDGKVKYGELISPRITIPSLGVSAVTLSFDSFRDVECYANGGYDKTYVEYTTDGGSTWTQVWYKDSADCPGATAMSLSTRDPISSPRGLVSTQSTGTAEGWTHEGPISIPVTPGEKVQVRFVFDTVDGFANNFLGWEIDNIEIVSAAPAGLWFLEQSLPEGLVTQTYSATIHVVGGTGIYSWRQTSTWPEAGDWLSVSFSGDTCTLSGTPTAAGTYQLCIGVSDDRGETHEDCYTIIIEQMITGGKLFYDDFEDSIAGWTTGGSLWHLTQNTPCVSPPYASPTHVYYYGRDATCNYATAGANSGTLTSPTIGLGGIVPGSDLTVGWKYWRDVEYYVDSLKRYDRSIVEYKFNNDTGWTEIWFDDSNQGKPMGGWNLVEKSTDSVGNLITVPAGAASLQIRFTFETGDGYANDYVGWLIDDVKVIQQEAGVGDLVITTGCPLPSGTEGVAYAVTLDASGGVPSYTWSANGLPTALTCSTSGVISGTPGAGTAASSPYSVGIMVTDSALNTASQTCSLTIASAPLCPCKPLEQDFESGLGSWTVSSLWHVAVNGCAGSCGQINNHYAYFGQDVVCDYNNGATVLGYLTSPQFAVDSCIDDLLLQFDHFREVESYAKAFDRTYIQIKWDAGAWHTVWYKDSKTASPNCENVVIGPITRAGNTLTIRFVFDSVDYLFNNYTGWAIDNVIVWNGDTGTGCGAPSSTVGPLSAIVPKSAPRDQISVFNIPNPVRDVHTTKFTVRGIGIEAIKIQIFGLDETMVFEQEAAGNELEWHTVNDYGEYVANGVYFYRALVKMGGKWISTGFQKLVILR